MASRDDEAMLCIVEEERRSHRRSRPARVPRYFQITALVWSAISSDHQPPEIHFKTVSVESLENRYLVMVDIKNVGDEAATEVHISAELKDAKDSTQRSTVKIDYLASKSTQRVGFYFESDPEAGELTFIPDNYLEP